ncbi:MAG: TetR/AcrR family transcriptional regulator [Desulfarculus sp.]|jgi:TetR/AcrR family fatty acid metabolism transcriptional regulator|nr:MAG: TetR/AcrR family transcriptional regulator [Desulfarculus sp.]
MNPQPPVNPTGTRRAQQKARTRELILEAAKERFATLGFERATIRDIAKYAGVGVGTVMSHFPDKTSLLSAALVADWAEAKAEVWSTMPPEASYREQFLHVARVFYTYYLQRPSLSRNLLRVLLFSPENSTEELRREDEEMLAQGALILQAAQQRGEIRPGLDCRLAVRGLFANYLYVLHWGLNQTQPTVEAMLELLDGLLDALIAGIGQPPGEPPA